MAKLSAAHRDPRAVGLVALGGMGGTLARWEITELIPNAGGFPTAVVAINVSGAFLLGWLLSAIAARGDETPARTTARLLIGTGVLGGFTTYGTFIDDEDMLLGMSHMVGTWVILGVPTVVLGIAAAWVGALCGRGTQRSATRVSR